MKKVKYTVTALAALGLLASCNLDLTPKGTITYNPGQAIITSASDLKGFEANVMANVRALDYGIYDIVPDLMVDYFNAVNDYGNNYGDVHRLDAGFGAGDYDIEDNWAGPYAAINSFNIFIEGAQVVPDGLQADAAVARGEAYFGRAFAYLHLARHFGKVYNPSTAATDLCVPLVTVYDQTARPERATVAKVYGQIKSDLDSAAVLLAGVEGAARAERPTVDAVDALYARYYLDVQDYAKAAAKAEGLVESGKYALSSTAAEMTAEWVNDNGKEPIVQYYASLSEGRGGHTAYSNMSQDREYGTYYRAYYIPAAKLINSYEDTDLRLAQWYDGGAAMGGYPSFHTGALYNSEETGFQFYVFRKYFGNPALYTSTPNTAHAVKPLLISEMYLIGAEAYLKVGNATAAKLLLNELQAKRGATATDATTAAIEKEWYRETVGEGLYFSCLKRWHKGFNGRAAQSGAASTEVAISGTNFDAKVLDSDAYQFCWPIPTYEIQTNLNLKQNDGYGKKQSSNENQQ